MDPLQADMSAEVAKAQKERDFYAKLLDLGNVDEPEPLLAEALALIVQVAGATSGYIEIGWSGSPSEGPRWSIARGCDDATVEQIRDSISHGVIAEAIATGTTIVTASAADDPRFKTRGSVRRNRIEAVLCAPVGVSPPVGVLYLQGRVKPGAFTEQDRLRAERFARHLALLTDRLLIRQQRTEESDPTRPLRALLDVSGLIGRSASLAKVLRDVRTVASRDVIVLLTGPTGTGKTDIARIIHRNGSRPNGPFVEISCANLQDNLFENELFGAAPGGHATAMRKIEGKVGAAAGGTLFLDEVGELSQVSQGKLLQFLQSKEYYALGASRPSRADVRIIAATNVDLEAGVEEHRFREDLFYRLHGFSIRVPSLAERREDIADLAAFFCARACDIEDLPNLQLSPGAMRAAEAAEWPGNVRQLANWVKRGVLRAHAEGALVIERQHLFPDESGSESAPGRPKSLQAAMRQYQAEYLRDVLAGTGWNITLAGEQLDITRSHVYNLIKAHGLKRSEAGE